MPASSALVVPTPSVNGSDTSEALRFDRRVAMGADQADAPVDIGALLDALIEPVAVFSDAGVLLHANRPFRELADGAAWKERLVLKTVEWIRAQAREPRPGASTLVREVSTPQGTLELRVCPLAQSDSSRPPRFALVIHGAPVGLDDERLRARFGLSPREARVARLLAEGKSNEQVARALSISPHTARHHTERVLVKFEVSSRAAIADRILRS